MAGNRLQDWLSRQTVPDLYPRKDDPFKPSAGSVPFNAPGPSLMTPEELGGGNPYDEFVTIPAPRPFVFQQAVNYQITLTAGAGAVPLQPGPFPCETIIIDVLSSAANSVFFGYGSGVTTASGLEVRAGLPIVISTENTREQWELQRLLEAILAFQASDHGLPPLALYKAPRVVFNANQYYLIGGGAVGTATTVGIMLFQVPEMQ
jgi:hypothetical protein